MSPPTHSISPLLTIRRPVQRGPPFTSEAPRSSQPARAVEITIHANPLVGHNQRIAANDGPVGMQELRDADRLAAAQVERARPVICTSAPRFGALVVFVNRSVPPFSVTPPAARKAPLSSSTPFSSTTEPSPSSDPKPVS